MDACTSTATSTAWVWRAPLPKVSHDTQSLKDAVEIRDSDPITPLGQVSDWSPGTQWRWIPFGLRMIPREESSRTSKTARTRKESSTARARASSSILCRLQKTQPYRGLDLWSHVLNSKYKFTILFCAETSAANLEHYPSSFAPADLTQILWKVNKHGCTSKYSEFALIEIFCVFWMTE